jgi:hypothetical protein
MIVNSSEIARSQQPDTFGKAWYFRLPLRADGQLFTADSAAAGKDGLTIGGLHAAPKPVRLGAAPVIRLKSSFGHFVPGNIDYTTRWLLPNRDRQERRC